MTAESKTQQATEETTEAPKKKGTSTWIKVGGTILAVAGVVVGAIFAKNTFFK